ncbi:parasitic phase-specific protein psp-1 [Colletotrichum musicola]|uniref:Parasitic phase-specific protein psp-1 n=1 Tax=Colletotrichum musicola TaxID=2175873 RepID=A0A8H6JGC7_9PEZI|nr:parasitic phase-specific protein psp-1 [Colletotrichum musicola]
MVLAVFCLNVGHPGLIFTSERTESEPKSSSWTLFSRNKEAQMVDVSQGELGKYRVKSRDDSTGPSSD